MIDCTIPALNVARTGQGLTGSWVNLSRSWPKRAMASYWTFCFGNDTDLYNWLTPHKNDSISRQGSPKALQLKRRPSQQLNGWRWPEPPIMWTSVGTLLILGAQAIRRESEEAQEASEGGVNQRFVQHVMSHTTRNTICLGPWSSFMAPSQIGDSSPGCSVWFNMQTVQTCGCAIGKTMPQRKGKKFFHASVRLLGIDVSCERIAKRNLYSISLRMQIFFWLHMHLDRPTSSNQRNRGAHRQALCQGRSMASVRWHSASFGRFWT